MPNNELNCSIDNILIVDDHPLTVEVHKGIISKALKEKKLGIKNRFIIIQHFLYF